VAPVWEELLAIRMVARLPSTRSSSAGELTGGFGCTGHPLDRLGIWLEMVVYLFRSARVLISQGTTEHDTPYITIPHQAKPTMYAFSLRLRSHFLPRMNESDLSGGSMSSGYRNI
jgi:hypothetical protein